MAPLAHLVIQINATNMVVMVSIASIVVRQALALPAIQGIRISATKNNINALKLEHGINPNVA